MRITPSILLATVIAAAASGDVCRADDSVSPSGLLSSSAAARRCCSQSPLLPGEGEGADFIASDMSLGEFEDVWLHDENSSKAVEAVAVQFTSPRSYAAMPSECNSGGYSWHGMPQGLIYRPYLAGAKESRLRGVWNNEANDGNIWDISLGGNVGLLRYGTRGDQRPEGIQIGIEGAGLVRLDRDENQDVDAVDFRFGIPITWGDAVSQWKFAYYHLSSHLGDEFLLKNPGYPRLNYSRDVLVLGHSRYLNPWWRAYGEVGYAVYTDVAEPWETQFGIEMAPPGRTGFRGAPFFAVNGHLREEVDFGGNFVVQAGWGWRRSPATGLFRVGVEHYNGKDDQFSFYNESVQKTGFGIWYDF
ncbi:MAG: DUF1207 domain-containing protein [Planctomycetales bacterium]|nr:DUF1207 domain-containing protein [Planctomycetales bacterium]